MPSEPLTWGDAEWPQAPIPQPGGEGNDGGGGDGDDGGTGGSGGSTGFTTQGFVPMSDFGAVSECDPFAQDCPDGEKCVAYGSTGGQLDANKCVPVTGTGVPSDPCVYGGNVEATDDCNDISYCWDVTDVMGTLEGTCTQFCAGTADDPVCPNGLECLIAYDGSINLCIDPNAPSEEQKPVAAPAEQQEPVALECPDNTDPLVLYMSNDDSNSQASPAFVRRTIHDGGIVFPDRVRIHEFLNYYTVTQDNPEDKPVEVGMQMRRIDSAQGEFALLLYAGGQQMSDDDRAPLNLVFSIDTSGSMSGEPIELVKDSMVALAGSLRVGDKISLVEWSDAQTVSLQNYAIAGPNDPVLINAIESLDTGGSTNLHDGLVKAYQIAEASYIDGGINRVILMSDGGANVGVTDVDLIGNAAQAEDGTGIYLVGVGVGTAWEYSDTLMDTVTDAGKGAYVFIDNAAEAELQFGDRFLSNVAVAARDVKMRATLPWYFGVKAFHGEEYSSDPAEVEPQHLAPNDSMNFHQIIAACNPDEVDANDVIEAHVEYLHPLTLEPMSETLAVPLGELVVQDASALYKADVVVSFAKALIVIGAQRQQGDWEAAYETAQGMEEWLNKAALALDDPEVQELALLMHDYVTVLMP